MEANINPFVVIGDNVEFGENVLIESFSVLRHNIYIGNNSQVRQHCMLAGDNVIGNNVKIFQYSNIAKGAIIEDNVYIGPRVLFLNTRKISHGRSFSPKLQAARVKRGARIGGGAILLPEVIIGEECLIGAGAVVTKDTDPFWVYVGNPARKLRPVPDAERL